MGTVATVGILIAILMLFILVIQSINLRRENNNLKEDQAYYKKIEKLYDIEFWNNAQLRATHSELGMNTLKLEEENSRLKRILQRHSDVELNESIKEKK